MTPDLEAKLLRLPHEPGVYLFRGRGRRILYIGKARNLYNRVRSYFQSGRAFDPKTEALTGEVEDLDYIATDSELEAFVLESTLVRRHEPRYNIRLKDDKRFLMIKLTVNEAYPRVLLTRRRASDGALYFGPYVPASLARNTVRLIHRHFQLRTCDIEIDGRRPRPCLEYDIKRCLGPCVEGLCTPEAYRASVEEVILLLQGKNAQLAARLEARMLEAAEQTRYEAAAFYRDRLMVVRDLGRTQKMVLAQSDDIDVFGCCQEGARLTLQLITLRDGKVIGKKEFFWDDTPASSPGRFLREALQQLYLSGAFIPAAIYLPWRIEDQDLMETWLTDRRGRRVRIAVPRRGDRRALVELATKNARLAFDTRFRTCGTGRAHALQRLREALDLPRLPERIEAFDVSNIQGSETVASMVVCLQGRMERSGYRKFRIREVEGPDDFASIREAVSRRYRRQGPDEALPDLVLIDGGRGQLHAAAEALDALGLDLPLASLAKREETIHVRGFEDPVILDRTSPALHLVQEIRDESHRFALAYHRRRRSLRDAASELDGIPGVGQVRRRNLLRHFGSLKRIRSASEAELARVVGPGLARTIRQRLG